MDDGEVFKKVEELLKDVRIENESFYLSIAFFAKREIFNSIKAKLKEIETLLGEVLRKENEKL